MDKQSKVKTLVLALGLLSLSGLAQADFVSGMNQQQVATEIGAQLKSRVSLDQIAKEANDADLNLAQVTEVLIKAGQRPAAVVRAVISVNPAAAESVAAVAVTFAPAGQASEIAAAAGAAAPSQAAAIIAAILTVPGVNPADVLSSTAAGPPAVSAKASERGRRGDVHAIHPSAGGGGHCKQDKNKNEDCASPS